MLLLLVFQAAWLMLQPFNSALRSELNGVHGTFQRFELLALHDHDRGILNSKVHCTDRLRCDWINGECEASLECSVPLLGAQRLFLGEFCTQFCSPKDYWLRLFGSADRWSRLKTATRIHSIGETHTYRLGSAPVETSKYGADQIISNFLPRQYVSVDGGINLQLLFDLLSPSERKLYRVKCSFAGELTEKIVGNCARIPAFKASRVKHARIPGSNVYQLVSECGDFATSIVYFRSSNDRSAIRSNDNFVLVRIDGNESPGYDLGTCTQRYDEEHQEHKNQIRLSVKSGDAGITMFDGHNVSIANTAAFVRVAGVWYRIVAP